MSSKRKYKHNIMTKQRIVKHKMKQFHHMFDRALNCRLSKNEVFVGEARLLMTISEKDKLTQKELATQMGTSPASVGVSLKKLENKGYVKRNLDENDSRAFLITLTVKGEDFVENTHEIFQKLDRDTFSGFTDEELETFDNFMDRLHENLFDILGDKA